MLEKICTDLETSKRLRELGFDDSESEFVYWEGKPNYYHNLPLYKINNNYNIILITCYTLEQVLSKLPEYYKSKSGYDYYFTYEKTNHTFYYQEEFNAPNKYEFSKFSTGSSNLATTAAKLWIKLKEDKII
jgi:hypothetical protein